MKLPGFLLVLIAVCGYAQTPADWRTLDRAGYSIKYPPTWKLDESGDLGSKFFLFVPVESENDDFMEHIFLVVQDLKGPVEDEYSRISEEQMKKMNSNVKVLESKKVTSVKVPYRKLIYTGDQANFNLQFEQYCWLINNKAYVLTFSAEQHSYEKFKNTAETIVKTFVIKK